MTLSLIAALVMIAGILMFHLTDKTKELGRAMMWIGIFFVVGELASWHAIQLK